MIRQAEISACGRYRYSLERRWGDGEAVTFVMLNPSTADAEKDDPTIRRCISFARDWGFNALVVRNLFAIRSTDKTAMKREPDPTGGDEHVLKAKDSSMIVAAWGGWVPFRRDTWALWEFRNSPLHYLKKTDSGKPWHPLYLPGDLKPIPWTCDLMTAKEAINGQQ